MHSSRLVLVIVIITLLGLITAWQQIQTVRWGYQISHLSTVKQNLTTEHHTMQVKLASIKSPNNLIRIADSCQLKLVYAGDTGLYKVREQINNAMVAPRAVQANSGRSELR
jgi:hypothetical protein